MNNMMNTTTVGETRPEHHVHKADEPLPGARGGAPTADYSTSAMERLPSSAWEDTDTSKPSREVIGENLDHPDHPTKPQLAHSGSASGRNAFSAERPLNTEPHPDGTSIPAPGRNVLIDVGGVAIEGGHHDDGMPMGKATTADKLIGKTQKVRRPDCSLHPGLISLCRLWARSHTTPSCTRRASSGSRAARLLLPATPARSMTECVVLRIGRPSLYR